TARYRVRIAFTTRRSSDLKKRCADCDSPSRIPGRISYSSPMNPYRRGKFLRRPGPKKSICGISRKNGLIIICGLPLGRGKKWNRSEEHTSELQSRFDLVCR